MKTAEHSISLPALSAILQILLLAGVASPAHGQTVTATIPVGSLPYGLAVDSTTNQIYVANLIDGTVSVIDGATATVTATIPVGSGPNSGPNDVAVDPATNQIYVGNIIDNTVSVIDGATATVTATIPVGNYPYGVGVDPATNQIYVTNNGDNTVSVIDGATATVTATIHVGSNPYGVGVDPATNQIYVTNNVDGTVSVIDGATATVTATIPVGTQPYGVGVDPATNQIYVTNNVDGTVSVIDGATATVTATIPVGGNPNSVGVDPATNQIYVTNNGANTVSVIDGATATVTATIPVGGNPNGVGVDPATNQIYVANFTDNTVSVISNPAPSSPPVSVNDTAVLTSAAPIAINVLANDSDPQSSPLTITAVTPPSVGLAVISGSTIVYTPNFNFGGYAGTDSFTYTITDGLSLSATATVTISNPFYLEKGNFAGTLHNTGGGYVTLNVSNNGRFSGKLRLGKMSYSFSGIFNVSGYAYLLVNGQVLILNMNLTQLAGDPFGSYTIGGSYAGVAFNSYHALYNSTSNPAPEAGKYTVLIDPPAQIGLATATASVSVTNGKIGLVSVSTSGSGYLSVPTVTITSSTGSGAAVTAIIGNGQVTGFKIVSGGTGYPTTGVTATIASPSGNPLGFGYATLSVGENGGVNISGKLADGTNISDGVYITGGATPYINQFPVYINLGYSNPGSLIGALTFENIPGVSDCDGALTWIKPVQTSGALYQGGVSATLATIASRYTPPLAHELALELPAGSPNATVTLNEQDWVDPISKAVTVGFTSQPSTEKVTVASPGADLLQMSVNANAGTFSGSFLNPSTNKSTSFSGVLFHKQSMAAGYFLSPTMSGPVTLGPSELP